MWDSNRKNTNLREATLLVSSVPKKLTRKKLVVALSTLGVLPFGAALLWPEPSQSRLFFGLYSMVIFSFLCGTWWATALVKPGNNRAATFSTLLLSIFLIIVAFLMQLLFFLHSTLAPLMGMTLLFAILLVGELTLGSFRQQPLYYRQMRWCITAIVAALHIGAAARFT